MRIGIRGKSSKEKRTKIKNQTKKQCMIDAPAREWGIFVLFKLIVLAD